VTRRTAPVERVWPQTQLLLDNLINTPAMVSVVLRCARLNPLAAALFIASIKVPQHHRNYLRLLFLHSEVRSRYDDWRSIARTCVAFPPHGCRRTPG